MFSAVVLALLAPASAVGGSGISALAFQDEPPIQVWLNKRENLDFGERVRVYVRAEYDGHMVVLHADPEGRIRVLFPLDPVLDDFVRGGRAYEIEGRSEREAFRSIDVPGLGTVYVAYSPDPFLYDTFARGDHWDYRALGDVVSGEDPEGRLTAVVQGMAQGRGFDYDVTDYYVTTPVDYRGAYSRYYGRFRYDPHYYDPFYDPFYHHHHSGFYLGVSFGYRARFGYGAWYDPWYYDPWYYDPWYYGYGWGYGRRYYYPTVYVVNNTTYRYASVNNRYTFRDQEPRDGVGYRRRSAGASTVASASGRVLSPSPRRPEPRRITADAGRRGSVSDTGRRTVPTRTGVTAESAAGRRTADAGTPDRRAVGDVEQTSRRQVTESVRRRASAAASEARTPPTRVYSPSSGSRATGSAGTAPSRRTASPPSTPAQRATPPRRSATASPADRGTAARRPTDAAETGSAAAPRRSSAAVTPAFRSRPTASMPARSSASAATEVEGARRATPSASTSQPTAQRWSQPTRASSPSATRSPSPRVTASPPRVSTSRPTVTRSPSSGASRPSVRPSSSGSRRPAVRPSSSGSSRPAARPSSSSSRRPAARPASGSSRPPAASSSSSSSRRPTGGSSSSNRRRP